uniref:DUF3700 domain-containing protein n=1 Tax=Lactuca sativa TaxID=4236 RepID=A0A9R1WDC6_LACSA|nr:hypothetical protein LSAT_V11C200074650 [Lactuca sativa]
MVPVVSENINGDATALAYVKPNRPYSVHQRLFTAFDDIYCLFMGSLNNLCSQIKQYGLSKNTNEAMVIIKAYRTLRDRGPYPADQVIKDIEGSFAFIVYDSKSGTIFITLGSDGGVKLYWGIAADEYHGNTKMEGIKHFTGRRRAFVQTESGCVLGMELDQSDNAYTVKRRLQIALSLLIEKGSLTFGDMVLKIVIR